jgi:predicted RNA-binding Zn-ribbon protein involved in translation (DUF1610 family)
MLINKRCTVCKERIDPDRSTSCGTCGRDVHSSCEEFEQQFDCPICADELEIGVVEL